MSDPTAAKMTVRAVVSAVVTRADGTIEDLGVISDEEIEEEEEIDGGPDDDG